LFLELKDVSDVSDVSELGLRTRHGCGVSRSWGLKRCSRLDLEEVCLSGLREIEVLFELDEMESFILVPVD